MSGDTWSGAGGLERYFRALAGGLSERGHRVICLVAGREPDLPERPEVVEVAPTTAALPVRMWGAFRTVRQLGLTFDSYNAHFAPYAVGPMLQLASSRLPVVCHFHGPWSTEELMETGSAWRAWLKRQLERLVYARATVIVTLSEAFRELVCEEYAVERDRVRVVPGGVDLERFHPTRGRTDARVRLGLPCDRFVVLTVRRLVRRMGLEGLLSAVQQIVAEHPEVLLLVGGQGPLMGEMTARIRNAGLEKHVRLVGFIEEAALPDYYRAADVFVIPSVALEGFGLVTLEALASGTPVIGTPVGGIPEVIGRLRPGLLTADATPSALAEKLAEAARDPSRLPSAEECRRFVERDYSWRTAVCAIETLLDEVTAAARRSVRGQRLRVAYVNGSQQISGAEINLLQTLASMAGRCVDPVVVVPDSGEFLDRTRGLGLPVRPVRLSMSRRPTRLLAAMVAVSRTLAVAWRVGRVLRQEQLDLVHANSIRDGLIASLALPWHWRPVVWSVHDFPPRGVLGRVVRQAARRIADGVITNSEAVRRDFERWNPGRMETIYPVLPDAAFNAPGGQSLRDEWGIPSSALVMGYVGQITPWKRVHDAIVAYQNVTERCDRAWLVIAGEPKFRPENTRYLEQLQSLVRDLRLGNRVRFLGFQQDVDRLYGCLDVLVHPSEREPFGRVVAEAMARGIAVVATNCGGIPEIVEDGRTGFLFPVGDVAALSQLVLRLFADEALRLRLGAEGRASACRFHVDRAVAQTLGVYERVLLAHSRRRRR